MYRLRTISVTVLLGHIWICSAQQACQPFFPGYIAPSQDKKSLDPKQVEGIWYSYRQFSNLGAEGILNPRIKWVPIAQTVNTNTDTPAWAMWAEFTQLVMPENTTCTQHYWTGQYSQDGRMIGNPTAVEDNYVMRQGDYAVLFQNHQKYLVGYGCYHRYTNGSCATTEVFMQSRKNPLDMTAADINEFDQIINDVFAPYCISTAILPRMVHSADKPFCDFLDPPDCTAKNIQGSKWFNSTPDAASGSGSKCQFPNSIGTEMNNDPTKNDNSWYGYRFHNPTAGVESVNNMKFHYEMIGPATMPLTNISAQLISMRYSFTNSSGCFDTYFVGAFGTNGLSDGLLGPIADTGDRITFRMSTLQLTNEFALYYGCIVPDTASFNCRVPFVLAVVSKNPSEWSEADTSNYDSIINSAFSKYGCSATDIKKVTWDTPPQCGPGAENNCITMHVKGLQEAVETDGSGTTAVPPTTDGPRTGRPDMPTPPKPYDYG